MKNIADLLNFFDDIDNLFRDINKNTGDNSMSLMALSDVFRLLHLCVDNANESMHTKKEQCRM